MEFGEIIAEVQAALGRRVIHAVKSGAASRKLGEYIRPILGAENEKGGVPKHGPEVLGEDSMLEGVVAELRLESYLPLSPMRSSQANDLGGAES